MKPKNQASIVTKKKKTIAQGERTDGRSYDEAMKFLASVRRERGISDDLT